MASYAETPHAVYRFYDKGGALLYVGCTADFARTLAHGRAGRWHNLVTRIELEWFPNGVDARFREASLIKEHNPPHNARAINPDSVTASSPLVPRGDGTSCPKCGEPKSNQKYAYCDACLRDYQWARKRASGWSPKRPTVVCPRCGGEKEALKSFCIQCTRQYHRDRRAKKRAGIQS